MRCRLASAASGGPPELGPGIARAPQAGFGLLEAIVALTILATTGLVLFAWVNQNMQSVARLKSKDDEARLLLEALDLLKNVNPAEQASGEMVQQGVRLRWQSVLVEPMRANATFSPPEGGPWRLGLYRLTVQAQRSLGGLNSSANPGGSAGASEGGRGDPPLSFDHLAIGKLRLQAVQEAGKL